MNKPQRNPALAWRKIADEAVIVELGTERNFHELNDVAAFIWNLCDGQHSFDEICQETSNEYEISNEEVRVDVQEFIADLQKLNLLA